MSDFPSNTSDQLINSFDDVYGVDKFDGSFENEELGCTVLINETINLVTERHLAAAGLYLYLLARPKKWRLNVKHLSSLFRCNKEKIYKLIDILIGLGVMSRIQTRENGKFGIYHYRTHLRANKVQLVHLPSVQKNKVQSVHLTPRPEKPYPVNPDTYKTKIIKNKEKTKTTTTTNVSISSSENKSSSSFFSLKHKKELLGHKLESDTRGDDEFLEHCQRHIEEQSNDFQKSKRIRGLLRILGDVAECGEHFKASKAGKGKILMTDKEPTKEDFEEWKKCTPGYEWVGTWRNKQQA